MQPLMTIAGIETKMLVTERVNHIRDILLSTDLTDFHVSLSLFIYFYVDKFLNTCSLLSTILLS